MRSPRTYTTRPAFQPQVSLGRGPPSLARLPQELGWAGGLGRRRGRCSGEGREAQRDGSSSHPQTPLLVTWGEMGRTSPQKKHCPVVGTKQGEWRGAGASTQPPRAGEGAGSPGLDLVHSTCPHLRRHSLGDLPATWEWRAGSAGDGEGPALVTPLSNISLRLKAQLASPQELGALALPPCLSQGIPGLPECGCLGGTTSL